jgi:hypothetical protein
MKTNERTEMAKARDVAPIGPGEQAYLRLWFSVAKRPWRSLVLVPGDAERSAETVARTLAEVGQKVSGTPVQSIIMSTLDYGTAQALADLQEQLRHISEERSEPPRAIEVYPVGSPRAHEGQEGDPAHEGEAAPNWAWARAPDDRRDDAQPLPPPDEGAGHDSRLHPLPASRFVIAVPFLLTEPLGLAATQGADEVLILVELGRTRVADVKAIVEQVGRERVTGCVLVK